MKICYIDEAGCTGALPSANADIQPVLAICGLVVDAVHLSSLTQSLIDAKQRFHPRLGVGSTRLGWILKEVKGNELRKRACSPARKIRRHTFGYINQLIGLVEHAGVRLVGRIWIKGIGQPFDGTAVYTSSMQSIYRYFQNLLAAENDFGVVIADSRLKHLNTRVAHSIFTQKFRVGGDTYSRIHELPAFSHSDNHAGLQVADLFCSALLFPLAAHGYCAGHVQNVHVRPGYQEIKDRYGARLMALQHRYQDATMKWHGGMVVSDAIGHRPGSLLFR